MNWSAVLAAGVLLLGVRFTTDVQLKDEGKTEIEMKSDVFDKYLAVGRQLIVADGYGSLRNVRVAQSMHHPLWPGWEFAIEVRLYDKNGSDYNKIDGELFFEDIRRVCACMDLKGIPLEALMAQAYTEGGAGKKGVYRMSNNLFGIRAGQNWRGYVYARNLQKTYGSYEAAVNAGGTDLFRAYESLAKSIEDYVNLISTSELYKGALGKSAKQYLKYLTKKGYGSERMVNIWMNVIKIYKLKGAQK